MKLKDFKKHINRYHSDYDDCEVGFYRRNEWCRILDTVPMEDLAKKGKVAICLNSLDGMMAITGDYEENSKKG